MIFFESVTFQFYEHVDVQLITSLQRLISPPLGKSKSSWVVGSKDDFLSKSSLKKTLGNYSEKLKHLHTLTNS